MLIISQIIAMQAPPPPPNAALAWHAHWYAARAPAQSLLYLDLGFWVVVLNALAGNPASVISLDHLFSASTLQLASSGGWITAAAFFLNAIAGCARSSPPPHTHTPAAPSRSAVFLCLIVERARKCLDFTATASLLHLVFTTCHAGWPSSWEWWAVIVLSAVVMSLLGEYLCMRREMQARRRSPRTHPRRQVLCASSTTCPRA